MRDEEILRKRLDKLKVEDGVWVIFIGLLAFSIYNNEVEREFLKSGNKRAKDVYRKGQIFIFLVACFIYFYYVIDSVKDILELSDDDSLKKVRDTYLACLGSFLIFIAGVIYLYIVITDVDVETEIAL